MNLFDILGGRIKYFNQTSVPVLNNIFAKIKTIHDETERQIFSEALMIAHSSIDMFFKPPAGPVMKDVKQYDKHDFELLNSIFIIWILFDLLSFQSSSAEKMEKKMSEILPINSQELAYYLEALKHETGNFLDLKKLWDEVVGIIHTMPNTEENFLVFTSGFSRIVKKVLQ